MYLNFPGLWTSVLMEFTAYSGLCVPHQTLNENANVKEASLRHLSDWSYAEVQYIQ